MNRILVSTLLALCLSGCTVGAGVATVTYAYPQPVSHARVFLKDAGTPGPVLLEVRDNPFSEDVARTIADAASHTSVGFATRFTTDPREATKPDFRMVVQFDAAPGTTGLQVCDPLHPVARVAPTSRLTAVVAFCRAGDPILSMTAEAPRPARGDSPIMRELGEQAMLRLFSPDPQDRDKPRWLLGSL